jgi:hypothetical protein
VRGLAIERALGRRGYRGEYAMFGPPLPFAIARRPSYRTVPIDPRQLLDAKAASTSAAAQALVAYAPDVLLVDLFWAPLVHILPLLPCPAWLLLRKVPPIWFVGPPGLPFPAEAFARVIAIEPGGVDRATETIDPLVVANPDELRPAGALREALRVRDGQRLEIVHQAGNPGELSAVTAQAGQGARTFTLGRDGNDEGTGSDHFFPLCEWLRDADRIVSAAGYNSFWEAHWLGYAERTTFVPFRRPIDDQGWRVRTCSGVIPARNGADVLARQLMGA